MKKIGTLCPSTLCSASSCKRKISFFVAPANSMNLPSSSITINNPLNFIFFSWSWRFFNNLIMLDALGSLLLRSALASLIRSESKLWLIESLLISWNIASARCDSRRSYDPLMLIVQIFLFLKIFEVLLNNFSSKFCNFLSAFFLNISSLEVNAFRKRPNEDLPGRARGPRWLMKRHLERSAGSARLRPGSRSTHLWMSWGRGRALVVLLRPFWRSSLFRGRGAPRGPREGPAG